MLHAYAIRFDVMENLEKFLVFVGTKQGLKEKNVGASVLSIVGDGVEKKQMAPWHVDFSMQD